MNGKERKNTSPRPMTHKTRLVAALALAFTQLSASSARAEAMLGGNKRAQPPRPPVRADSAQEELPEWLATLTKSCTAPWSKFEESLRHLQDKANKEISSLPAQEVTKRFANDEPLVYFVSNTWPTIFKGKDDAVAGRDQCSKRHQEIHKSFRSASPSKADRLKAIDDFSHCLQYERGQMPIPESAKKLIACYKDRAEMK